MICLKNLYRAIAKKYINHISSHDDFNKLVSSLLISETEKIILYKVFVNQDTIYRISSELNLSESTISRYKSHALDKVYVFLSENKVKKT